MFTHHKPCMKCLFLPDSPKLRLFGKIIVGREVRQFLGLNLGCCFQIVK